MKLLDLTLPTPQENLACDEALLDLCEDGPDDEILRFWEPRQHFVVIGYSNKVHTEVNLQSCRARAVPVLRRPSGGGAVLQGPGCLNYALALKIHHPGPLTSISSANLFILQRHRRALARLLGRNVEIQGHTDLTVDGRKFSGNSQRRKRHALLFHGSFLLEMDLKLIEELLPMPSRQPDYRQHRPHSEFLTNLHVPASRIKEALRKAWNASAGLDQLPYDQIAALAKQKYCTDAWNFRL
jgi:lipoate-protein ligase A